MLICISGPLSTGKSSLLEDLRVPVKNILNKYNKNGIFFEEQARFLWDSKWSEMFNNLSDVLKNIEYSAEWQADVTELINKRIFNCNADVIISDRGPLDNAVYLIIDILFFNDPYINKDLSIKEQIDRKYKWIQSKFKNEDGSWNGEYLRAYNLLMRASRMINDSLSKIDKIFLTQDLGFIEEDSMRPKAHTERAPMERILFDYLGKGLDKKVEILMSGRDERVNQVCNYIKEQLLEV